MLGRRSKVPTTGEIKKFAELDYGTLFIVKDYNTSQVWCKTPCADMYALNNRYNNADGAFCTAVLVNTKSPQYMQASPQVECIIIDSIKIFGKVKEE